MSAPQPEDLLTFADVARVLPSDSRGRRVSTSTVWRWANKGLRGRKLQCIRMGRKSVTTWRWLLEFFEHKKEAVRLSTSSQSPRSSKRATDRALDHWGV